ncbi:hypothetical protein ASE31_20700 [Acidovorax sp. Root217]|nr:hypothetical protein ASE31_20700 [Acidovorax sp. Root217]
MVHFGQLSQNHPGCGEDAHLVDFYLTRDFERKRSSHDFTQQFQRHGKTRLFFRILAGAVR